MVEDGDGERDEMFVPLVPEKSQEGFTGKGTVLLFLFSSFFLFHFFAAVIELD
jgi:hypothetical protein